MWLHRPKWLSILPLKWLLRLKADAPRGSRTDLELCITILEYENVLDRNADRGGWGRVKLSCSSPGARFVNVLSRFHSDR